MTPLPFLAQQMRPAAPATGSGHPSPASGDSDAPDAAIVADFAALLDGSGIHGMPDVIARAQSAAPLPPGEDDDTLLTDIPPESAPPTGNFLPVALPDGISDLVPAQPNAVASGDAGRNGSPRRSSASTASTAIRPAVHGAPLPIVATVPAPAVSVDPHPHGEPGASALPGPAVGPSVPLPSDLTPTAIRTIDRPVPREFGATIALSDIAIVSDDAGDKPGARPAAEAVLRQLREWTDVRSSLAEAPQVMQAALPAPLQSLTTTTGLASTVSVGQSIALAAETSSPDGRAANGPGGDLGALVDRIVEARAAAQPFAVRASMNHAEFGQISLHFRADERHISATVASPDPAFAPAVHSAVAAALSNDAGQPGRDGPRGESASGQHTAQHDRAFDGRSPSGSGHERGERHATRDWELPRQRGARPGEQHGASARATTRRGDLFA